ncbi:uncharacterized protein [Anabrus simplex]|uniref:uncharacterized protein n=1 Tax=Anabrus simplex TaxID=316456 RepID=UPI0034DD5238
MLPLRLFAVLSAVLVAVHGHGMLIDPPNRGSMWRFGFKTPPNYDDDGQFCGGREVQIANGGKCGECGDDYRLPRPRPAENGGLYGQGIIVDTYREGQVITAVTELTANHWGYFEYKLCPLGQPTEMETEECFSKYPLPLADGSGYRYYLLSKEEGKYPVKLKLPEGLTCDQCVLQWTYRTANTWGMCPNGTGADGCGPQEHFRTCSDIAIH